LAQAYHPYIKHQTSNIKHRRVGGLIHPSSFCFSSRPFFLLNFYFSLPALLLFPPCPQNRKAAEAFLRPAAFR